MGRLPGGDGKLGRYGERPVNASAFAPGPRDDVSVGRSSDQRIRMTDPKPHKDPHEALENLEKASIIATAAIALAIFAEIVIAVGEHGNSLDTYLKQLPNVVIGLALSAECWIVWKTLHATREANREAGEKVAEANERAEEAREHAAIAELETERLRKTMQPRRIDPNKLATHLAGKAKPQSVEIICLGSGSDTFVLSQDIFFGLQQAGWPVASFPLPIQQNNTYPASVLPAPTWLGSDQTGVAVAGKWTTHTPNQSYEALSDALQKQLGGIKGSNKDDLPDGHLCIIVSAKP